MKRALVVDDSLTVRRIIRRIMESLGFEVEEASDGRAALEAIERRPVDVVMLDWNMPVMDGLSFLRQLRANPSIAATTVIFCTSMNELPRIQEALDAGADEYVMKPFDEELIREKLEQTGLL
jgi:two-component system chemotaxis response regulator CheY